MSVAITIKGHTAFFIVAEKLATGQRQRRAAGIITRILKKLRDLTSTSVIVTVVTKEGLAMDDRKKWISSLEGEVTEITKIATIVEIIDIIDKIQSVQTNFVKGLLATAKTTDNVSARTVPSIFATSLVQDL